MSVLTSLWLFMSRVVVSPHKELNEGISPTNSQKDTSAKDNTKITLC